MGDLVLVLAGELEDLSSLGSPNSIEKLKEKAVSLLNVLDHTIDPATRIQPGDEVGFVMKNDNAFYYKVKAHSSYSPEANKLAFVFNEDKFLIPKDDVIIVDLNGEAVSGFDPKAHISEDIDLQKDLGSRIRASLNTAAIEVFKKAIESIKKPGAIIDAEKFDYSLEKVGEHVCIWESSKSDLSENVYPIDFETLNIKYRLYLKQFIADLETYLIN